MASTREVHPRQLGPVVRVEPEETRAVGAVGVAAGEVDLAVEARGRRVIDRQRQAWAGTPGRAVERINRIQAGPDGVEAAHDVEPSALDGSSGLLDGNRQRDLLALGRLRSGRGKGAESNAWMSRRGRGRSGSTTAAAGQQQRDPQPTGGFHSRQARGCAVKSTYFNELATCQNSWSVNPSALRKYGTPGSLVC